MKNIIFASILFSAFATVNGDYGQSMPGNSTTNLGQSPNYSGQNPNYPGQTPNMNNPNSMNNPNTMNSPQNQNSSYNQNEMSTDGQYNPNLRNGQYRSYPNQGQNNQYNRNGRYQDNSNQGQYQNNPNQGQFQDNPNQGRFQDNPSQFQDAQSNLNQRQNRNSNQLIGLENSNRSNSNNATMNSKTDQSNTASSKHTQDRFATDSDRDINEKIRYKITGWLSDDYKNVAINTKNGRVQIEGYVDSEDARKYLIDEARKIQPNAVFNVQIKEKA